MNPETTMSAPPRIAGRTSFVAAFAIGLAAFAVEIPFFFLGTPSGHDVEFHLYSWLEVLAQWKQGVFFPRWAAMAHFTYGEPRFIFYPPGSWTLGAILTAIFPWTWTASIYIWIVLVAAGLAMFALLRRWLEPRDAIFGAVLYAVNPYHLVIVYWRSAFAELLASCLVPLLLLSVLRLAEGKWRAWVPLALVLAAAWLSNAPAALMIHYSLGLLLLIFAWQRGSPRILVQGAAAVILAACLASFYLLPAIYEQKWVNIAEAVSAGSRPADNFLFIHTSDADHDAFNRLISWVAVLEMVLALGAGWAAKSWRAQNRPLSKILLAWALACSVLMFPVTALLWRYLPKLQFMQFPWRWLLCLSLLFTIFITTGVRRWTLRAAICLTAILVIVTAWHRIQPPWWDNLGDLHEMQDNMTDGPGYEGTDEYTPSGCDPATIEKDGHNVRVDGTAHAAIRVLQWKAESKVFVAEMSAPDRLALTLFSYPAWRVDVNGHEVETSQREGTGQMLVPVQAGINRVQITFTRTWDRTLGGTISLLTAGLLLLARWRRRAAA